MVDLIGLAIQVVKWAAIVAFCLALLFAILSFAEGGRFIQVALSGFSSTSEGPWGFPVEAATAGFGLFESGTWSASLLSAFSTFVAACVSATVALAGWRAIRWFTGA